MRTPRTMHRALPGLARLLVGLLLLAGGGPAWGGKDRQELLVQVAVPSGVVLTRAIAEVERLGETRSLRLADDGRSPGDVPLDGIYVGRDRGPVAHYGLVRLLLTEAGEDPVIAYEGIVRLADADQEVLGFVVARSPEGGGLSAERAAIALPGRGVEIAASLPTIALFGWGLFALVAVGWVLRRPARSGG